MEVYFDEARKRSPEAIVEGARFFHHIDPAAAAEGPFEFEHPCPCVDGTGVDAYRGTFCMEAPDRFKMLWHISGPKKDGVIENVYVRR